MWLLSSAVVITVTQRELSGPWPGPWAENIETIVFVTALKFDFSLSG
jgi:hypothetical protein